MVPNMVIPDNRNYLNNADTSDVQTNTKIISAKLVLINT